MSKLELHELTFSYGSRRIIDQVSLAVEAGDFLGLVGPNGAGKTTLLKLMSGYLGPESGTVRINASDLQGLSRREAASQLAIVPQQAWTSFPYRAQELVLMGRHPYAGLGLIPTRDDLDIVQQSLEQVGIAHLGERQYDRLSGGEQRLVLLARALAQRTPILLLDEPLTALDLQHQWQVLKLLKELQEKGTGIVATFHDLNLAAQWCSSLALLHNGRIVAEGNAAAVFRSELLQQVYGLPLQVACYQGTVRVNLPA